MNIYLSGPIDLDTNKNQINWRTMLMDELYALHFAAVGFDPSKPFRFSEFGDYLPARSMYVEAVNEAALLRSDLVVVFLPLGIQTIGTIVEMDLAIKNKIRLIIITNIPAGKSLYLDNRGSFWDKFWWDTTEDIPNILKIVAERISEPVKECT